VVVHVAVALVLLWLVAYGIDRKIRHGDDD